MITEKNLDRFDTTCLTWRHPSFSRERLSHLLFDCYKKFFSFGHTMQNAMDEVQGGRPGFLKRSMGGMAMSLFTRYCAWQRRHPMSGGVRRARLDSVSEYLSLRQQTFGFELAPLPKSLQLPATELALQPDR